ncbi:ABC transporter permease [Nitrosomonas sp. JL21]|uniref:permease-like cell division protein FtsX n=1 Tax=Nitrosomonas sp. JL21 TaxID=153949 RepID=UPI00136AC6EA|nr:permease-like cell division protein FtsX [Nitrosomonas sp. JL21]MBL8497318.1 ABC transporter permease [Nitrosomonas sp.]MXS77187.1 ABC transporter permease [Nitrosomonas sp. JL21]
MIRAWIAQHAFVLLLTLKRLISTPMTSLLSIIVMGIALSLPTGVYILMKNIESATGQAINLPQMSLFLKHNPTPQDLSGIRQRLEEEPHIIRFQFVSKEAALFQLQQNNGLPEITAHLSQNPLPDAFILHTQANSSESLEQLRQAMQEWPEVEQVQFDSVWIERLNELLKLGRFIVLMLAILLSSAIIAIMFNTIRLQILTQQDEIEISKLIGATDSFIRRPFLYFGALQGFVSGVAAWIFIAFFIERLNEELIGLARLYQTDIHLQYLSIDDSLSLLFFSAWLGWLGARLSVANHLWKIEPR